MCGPIYKMPELPTVVEEMQLRMDFIINSAPLISEEVYQAEIQKFNEKVKDIMAVLKAKRKL